MAWLGKDQDPGRAECGLYSKTFDLSNKTALASHAKGTKNRGAASKSTLHPITGIFTQVTNVTLTASCNASLLSIIKQGTILCPERRPQLQRQLGF